MNSAAAEAFHSRFRRVLEYIDAHLAEELSVDQLSAVAAFSKFHFHRQFSALFGFGVYKYIQLSRLKRASYKLAFRADQPVIDIALDSGYDGPEAFARAFKKSVGQTPTEFRQQPQWHPWNTTLQPLTDVRTKHMKTEYQLDQVSIVDFPETKVAALEHRGDPKRIGESVRDFITWRKQQKLHPSVSATFNIVYDNPADVAPEDFRCDLCAAIERELPANPFGIIPKVIPAGRCAVLRHVGSTDNIAEPTMWMYSEWLPHSGEELRDDPLVFQYLKFFPDVPEHEAVTDIFLPLR